jgi:TrmH family RNA methyltransferase
VLSKNKIKLIKSLDLKKNRLANSLFVAEGKKLVFDLLSSEITVSKIFCTKLIYSELINCKNISEIEIVEKEELARISFLKTTPEIVAVFKIPESVIDWNEIKSDLTLVLDSIQDPGNLGTIVRLADWFGIRNIICSEDSADLQSQSNPINNGRFRTGKGSLRSIIRVSESGKTVKYSGLRSLSRR